LPARARKSCSCYRRGRQPVHDLVADGRTRSMQKEIHDGEGM
jgi:hypothetical protein